MCVCVGRGGGRVGWGRGWASEECKRGAVSNLVTQQFTFCGRHLIDFRQPCKSLK